MADRDGTDRRGEDQSATTRAHGCGLVPAEPRCRGCPYWPICGKADAEHWNDPAARPWDWATWVEFARVYEPIFRIA